MCLVLSGIEYHRLITFRCLGKLQKKLFINCWYKISNAIISDYYFHLFLVTLLSEVVSQKLVPLAT